MKSFLINVHIVKIILITFNKFLLHEVVRDLFYVDFIELLIF